MVLPRFRGLPLSFCKSAVRACTDFVLPPRCSLCGVDLTPPERVVCTTCLQGITCTRSPFCQRCGRPLQPEQKILCPTCRRTGGHSTLRCRSVGLYEGVLEELIRLLKYRRKLSLGEHLGVLMAHVAIMDPVLVGSDVVVPVPLHWTRRRERGYNQSDILARSVARHMRLPYCNTLLRRIRPTRSQTLLSTQDRKKNVDGAFRAVADDAIREKKILLVDDVLTSGATMEAAAQALVGAGARCVVALTAAVARPRGSV